MEIDWSTFLLEIINFLILVWILKRFLYKPVLNVIARRQANVEKVLAGAETTQSKAQALQQQFQSRIQDWEQEREGAHAGLQEELRAERKRLMTALQSDLDQERSKAEVLQQRRLDEVVRQSENLALGHACTFISRIFTRLATPEVEAKLVELALEDLGRITAERRRSLQVAWEQMREPVQVHSAYPLSSDQQARIVQALEGLLGEKPVCEFQQDPALMAGLRIAAGPWLFHADLQDELKFFSEAANRA